MIDNDAMVQVRNLMGHTVAFKDEDTHRRIVFQPYETKTLDAGILRRLNYSHGGQVLLTEYLCVEENELAKEFGVSEDLLEHEYKWTKDDIDNVLTNGSLDELRDALDFAPEGIVQMIVDRAVELKLDNMSKRQIIQEATGHNITNKINNIEAFEAAKAADGQEERTTPTSRRVKKNVDTKEESTGRRVK